MTDQIAETEENIDKTEASLDMNTTFGQVILEEILGIMVGKIVGQSIEKDIEIRGMIEAETDLEIGHFPITKLEVQATVDPGQDPEIVQIGIEFIVISVIRNLYFSFQIFMKI